VRGDAELIEAVLDEYLAYHPFPAQDDLIRVETALFIEEAFGITLTDAEMGPETLGSRDTLRALLLSRTGKA
jgi:hypothetical protein